MHLQWKLEPFSACMSISHLKLCRLVFSPNTTGAGPTVATYTDMVKRFLVFGPFVCIVKITNRHPKREK